MSYWTYPCRDLRELWYAALCTWKCSRLYRTLFYFSRRERWLRYHLRRAKELGCDVYCLYHGDDARKCVDDPIHA